jgi:pimeloyl-ACP methyl ester carboxylesterase
MGRVALAALVAAWIAAAPAAAETISAPASFAVTNTDGSGAPCSSDGKPYVLRGEVTGPRAVVASNAPATATLYLHEYSFDDYWHFQTVPGVDYAAAMAAAGHVSVTIDRLGYDDSPQPDGSAICIGAHADMAHQIVQQLRHGTYQLDGAVPRRFSHVVLAGHSVGAVIAELEAYSFADIDALMLFGHSDGDYSAASLQTGVAQGMRCAAGGDTTDPAGYAFYGSADESRALAYHDAEPAVVDAQLALRHPDPCGDVNSLIPAIAVNKQRVGEIAVPVFLVYGRDDATLAEGAPERQEQAYTGSDDVSSAFFDRTGHALVLERAGAAIEASVAAFLSKHGFGPVPAARTGLIRVHGLPRRCVRHGFRVRVGAPTRRVRVFLDGHLLRRAHRRNFTVRVPARRLSPGRHRLKIAVHAARRVLTFRRCA